MKMGYHSHYGFGSLDHPHSVAANLPERYNLSIQTVQKLDWVIYVFFGNIHCGGGYLLEQCRQGCFWSHFKTQHPFQICESSLENASAPSAFSYDTPYKPSRASISPRQTSILGTSSISAPASCRTFENHFSFAQDLKFKSRKKQILSCGKRLGNARLKKQNATFRNLASGRGLFGWLDAKRSHKYRRLGS